MGSSNLTHLTVDVSRYLAEHKAYYNVVSDGIKTHYFMYERKARHILDTMK